jgi:hypothetical protein
MGVVLNQFTGCSAELCREEESEAIPETGRGGTQGSETSGLPHFLDNRLTDCSEVSLMRRPPLNPRKIPGTPVRGGFESRVIMRLEETFFNNVMLNLPCTIEALHKSITTASNHSHKKKTPWP